jgi:tripartite ATP-independent transporter DctM subunit
MMTLILLGIFFSMIVLRVPITVTIGIAVLCSLLAGGYSNQLYIIPHQILEGIENQTLLAIPLFVMAGNLMNVVGLTDKIYDFACAMVGHFRAGLAQVNVVASMIFAGISGAAVADCAGLGAVEIKAMKDRGYPADFSAAISVASSVIGPIIPPSISLVIYAFLSQTSVGRLFIAGIVPGIFIGAMLMIYNRIIADRRGFPREQRATLRKMLTSGVHGLAALVTPVIIIFGIVGGFVTANEAGVLACAYTLILGFCYRTLTWRKIWTALGDTTIMSGVIMIIIGYSQVMGWLMAIEQVPQTLADTVLMATNNRYVFLGILTVFLMLIGCVIDGVPAKIILVPVLLPIVDQLGIDRIHFGLIITVSLVLGICTPPMGIGLFIVSEVGNVSFDRVVVATLPLLVPLIIGLLCIVYIPQITLWLPNLLLGPG